MRYKRAAVHAGLPLLAMSMVAWSAPAAAQTTAAERAAEAEQRPQAGLREDAREVAEQAEAIQAVEALLRQAEAAQQRGDCPAYEAALVEIHQWTDFFVPGGRHGRNMQYDRAVPSETQNEHLNWRGRIEAAGCPLGSASAQQAATGNFIIGGSIGSGQIKLPQAFEGFVERNGDEVPANVSRRTTDFVSYNPFIGFLVDDRPLIIELSHTEGDSESVFDIEPLIRSGAPYAGSSPGLSTGFSAFEGFSGNGYSEYHSQSVTTTWHIGGEWAPVRDIRFRGSYNRAVRAPNIIELFSPNMGVGLDVFGEVSNTETDHLMQGGVSGTAGGGFNFNFLNVRQFSLDETRVSAGLLGRVGADLAPNVSIEFTIAGGLSHSWRDFSLIETNTINFGPDAPGFTHSFTESDHGFGAFARGGATIVLDLTDNFSVFARGRLALNTEAVAPFTPGDGDAVLAGQRAGIATDETKSGSIELGIEVTFGPGSGW